MTQNRLFRNGMFILAILTCMVFAACDTEGDSDEEDERTVERGTIVIAPGTTIEYGQTYMDNNIALTDLPFSVDFSVQNPGSVAIGYWGIQDITDFDAENFHGGNMTIDYADIDSSFDLDPDETYPFTVTLDDIAGGTAVTAGTTYQMEIGIANKNDVTPNPFIFKVRFVTLP